MTLILDNAPIGGGLGAGMPNGGAPVGGVPEGMDEIDMAAILRGYAPERRHLDGPYRSYNFIMNDIGSDKNQLDTPALWVDLETLERNIAALAAHFAGAGVAWRPHTKGIKTPAIVHKLLAAGAIGITCAKVSEAEIMVAAGVRDILIANQIVTPHKIARLVNLCRQVEVKVLVDDAANVSAIGAAAHAIGATVGVLVEVNTGMDRSGVLPGAATLALAQHIAQTPGLHFDGLQTWEGHNLAHSDPATKQTGIAHSIGQLLDSADLCRANGLPVRIVSAGGSGTYAVTPFIKGVTEIEAGGAIFCDLMYQSWGVALQPALFVRATVTSRPTPTRIILDCGFKTLTRGFLSPQLVGVADVHSVVLSAEHGIVTLSQPNTTLRVGDGVDLVPGYGDATVFAHDVMFGVRNGRVEAAWPVLGRGKIQ